MGSKHGWDFRVMQQRLPEPESCMFYGIHEVYYDDDGKPKNWTTNPTNVSGVEPESIAWTLERHAHAMTRPLLSHDDGSEVSPLPAGEYLAQLTRADEVQA